MASKHINHTYKNENQLNRFLENLPSPIRASECVRVSVRYEPTNLYKSSERYIYVYEGHELTISSFSLLFFGPRFAVPIKIYHVNVKLTIRLTRYRNNASRKGDFT